MSMTSNIKNYEMKIGLINLAIISLTWILNEIVMLLEYEHIGLSIGYISGFEAISIFLLFICLMVVSNLVIGGYRK